VSLAAWTSRRSRGCPRVRLRTATACGRRAGAPRPGRPSRAAPHRAAGRERESRSGRESAIAISRRAGDGRPQPLPRGPCREQRLINAERRRSMPPERCGLRAKCSWETRWPLLLTAMSIELARPGAARRVGPRMGRGLRRPEHQGQRPSSYSPRPARSPAALDLVPGRAPDGRREAPGIPNAASSQRLPDRSKRVTRRSRNERPSAAAGRRTKASVRNSRHAHGAPSDPAMGADTHIPAYDTPCRFAEYRKGEA
jgi:hypothetical protein